MNAPYRVAYVGTDEAFAASVEAALSDEDEAGWRFERIESGDGDPLGDRVDGLVVEDDPPTLDGVEVAAEREDGAPVVLLGADTTERRTVDALEAGVEDYLPRGSATPSLVAERVRSAVLDSRRPPEWYRSVVEGATAALLVLDEDGTVTFVNRSVEGETGHAVDDLVGTRMTAFVHPDDRAAVTEALDEVVGATSGASRTIQYRAEHADESVHQYEATLTNRLDDPTIEGVVVSAREITERARLEAELDRVFGRVTDAFFALDTDWRFTYVNDHAEVLIDRTEEELLGEVVWDVFPAAVGTEFQEAYERTMRTGEPVSFEAYFDPLETWFEVRAYPSTDGLSVYFKDITERKERERDLEQYETIARRASDVIVTIDTESRIRAVNPAVEDVFGHDPDELVGESLTTLVPDRLADAHLEGVRRYLETEERSLDWDAVELPGLRADGTEVPLEISFSEYEHDGERYFTGIVRDVSEQRARERQLERYRTIVETVGEGVYVLDEESRYTMVNDAYCDITGYDREELVGEPAATATGERIATEMAAVQAALDTDETGSVTFEMEFPTRDGETVPVEATISRFPFEDGSHGRVGIVRDITAQRRFERTLERLNELGQELTEAETPAAACREAVEAARETLDLPITRIEAYDEESGRLTPLARTPAAEALDGRRLFPPESDAAWRAYANGERLVSDDLLSTFDLSPDDTDLRSAIVHPLGEHGVLVSGATEPNAFSESDVDVVEMLAENTRAALDRVAREQTLRERTTELEHKTRSLQRLNRINELIRNLTQALTQATTREDIDRAVCRRLQQADPYRFVWTGETTVAGEEIQVRSTAGDGEGYLDSPAPVLGDYEDGLPSAVALETGETHVENDIHTSPPLATWRQSALAAGFRSAIAVPLRHRDSVYGVLTVYAGERDVFTEMEAAVLEELGGMVGYAINALERKQALISDTTVELGFAVADPAIPAFQFVEATGGAFEFETMVSEADGSLRTFFTTSGVDPDTVVSFADRVPSVSGLTHITEQDDGHLFEAITDDEGFLGTLLEHGAHVKEMSVEGSEGQVVLELPKGMDVGAFVDMFLSTYEGSELRTRRELDQPIQTEQQFRAVYRERLTERQEEVIRTAYFSGFFEWPRDVTGQEVAASLDVSQPTVNRHIRTGQRKLFSLVFDDD